MQSEERSGWIFLRLPYKIPKKYSFICSKHFSQSDIRIRGLTRRMQIKLNGDIYIHIYRSDHFYLGHRKYLFVRCRDKSGNVVPPTWPNSTAKRVSESNPNQRKTEHMCFVFLCPNIPIPNQLSYHQLVVSLFMSFKEDTTRGKFSEKNYDEN